jgi:hypothetical protein
MMMMIVMMTIMMMVMITALEQFDKGVLVRIMQVD